MVVLIQRVSSARVEVDLATIAQIGKGLLVFVGFEGQDQNEGVEKMLKKVIHYRVFEDDAGKMNQSLWDIQGDLLIVPQFTLAADTQKGARPSFSTAAAPDKGLALFQSFAESAQASGLKVAFGRFGANMTVHLVNQGPATFVLC